MNIRISLKSKAKTSYVITVEPKLLKKIPSIFREKAWGSHYCIVTDKNVQKLYGDDLLAAIKTKGLKASLVSVTPGETSKKAHTAEMICEKMLELGVRRDGCIIALGGGVIGDLAGFAASIYMRGINLVHIPTTLLAMVDSAIGGKTGVDLASGKNMIGTFHQPSAVFIDPIILATLPKKELKNGFAEIVKHAVIKSRPLFIELEKNVRSLESAQMKIFTKIISQNVALKAKIVQADEKESIAKRSSKGSRMILNYGHTIGHAIEQVSDYQIEHGEAVSIGMVLENIIAVKKELLAPGEAKRIEALLKAFKLPTRLPVNITPKKIHEALKKDKKMINGAVHFVLPVRIGQAVVRDDIV